jgi:hypothetical protein
MLPDDWKKEIEKTIDQADARNAERHEAQIVNQNAIAASFDSLADEFVGYKRETREREEGKRRREIATIIGLFLNAFLVLVTAVIFAGQLYEAHKVYGPIKQSADAAKESADAARVAINLSSRAELVSDDWSVNHAGPNESPIISFRINNTGPSHAHILRATYDFVIASGLPDKFAVSGNLDGFPALMGGKAQSDQITVAGLPTISTETWASIQGGKKAIFLRATFFYQNEFGDVNELRTTGRYGLTLSPQGNKDLRFTFPDASVPISVWGTAFERRLNYMHTVDPKKLEK